MTCIMFLHEFVHYFRFDFRHLRMPNHENQTDTGTRIENEFGKIYLDLCDSKVFEDLKLSW